MALLPASLSRPTVRGRGPRPAARAALLPVAALTAGLAVAALASAAPAAAGNPAGPHDSSGAVEHVTVSADSVRVRGWAYDPDAATSNATVYGLVDGRTAVRATTSVARPNVAAAHRTGPTPGFDVTIPVPAAGQHTACLAVQNVGVGISRVLKCVSTPAGTRLTSAQLAAHSPSGVIGGASAGRRSLSVRGWVKDPDFVDNRVTVVLYVDGVSTRTVVTRTTTAAQREAGAGVRGSFSISVPVGTGAHNACVWAVNAGFGGNTFLGCRAVDTRGRAGTDAVTQPTINTKALREATRHLGQPYVWGAAGPRTFDCSGLVLYSYHKAGFTTPRIAQDQFAAARVIPASRAVPGDLVFYHDSVGAVYHVGLYVAPLDTVAAIDPEEGVAHQHIWDPSTATYGSFTHT